MCCHAHPRFARRPLSPCLSSAGGWVGGGRFGSFAISVSLVRAGNSGADGPSGGGGALCRGSAGSSVCPLVWRLRPTTRPGSSALAGHRHLLRGLQCKWRHLEPRHAKFRALAREALFTAVALPLPRTMIHYPGKGDRI